MVATVMARFLHREAELQRREFKFGECRQEDGPLFYEAVCMFKKGNYVSAHICLDLALEELLGGAE